MATPGNSGLYGANSQMMNAFSQAGVHIGESAAKTIANSVTKMLDSYVDNTFGKLSITDSFSKGSAVFAEMRRNLGNLTFSDKSLKDFGTTILKTYEDMKERGIIVSPSDIYKLYDRVGELVNLSGTSNSRLTSLLTTVTEMNQAGGAKIDTTSYAFQLLSANYSETLLKTFQSDINLALSGWEQQMIDVNSAQQIANSKSFETLIAAAKSSGMSSEDLSTALENAFQQYAFYGGNGITSDAIKQLSGLMDSIASASESQIQGLFSTNPAMGSMLASNGLTPEILTDDRYFSRNYNKILETVVDVISSSSFGSGDPELAAKYLNQYLGFNMDAAKIREFQKASSNGNISDSDLEKYINQDINGEEDYYKAATNTLSIMEQINTNFEALGVLAPNETYENQMLAVVSQIGVFLKDNLGGMQGGLGGFLGGLLGAGGIGAVFTSIPVWGWITGAVAGVSLAIIEGIGQMNREINEDLTSVTDSVKDIINPESFLSRISENTGGIVDIMKEDNPTSPNSMGNQTFVGYDASGNPIFESNIDEQGNDVTGTNLSKQYAALTGNATSNYASGKVRAGRVSGLNMHTDGNNPFSSPYASVYSSSGNLSRVSFSKQVADKDLWDDRALMGYVTTPQEELDAAGITVADIRAALLDAYYSEEDLRTLKLAKLLTMPGFQNMWSIYEGLGLFEKSDINAFTNNDLRSFINNYPERINKLIDNKELFYKDSYTPVSMLANMPQFSSMKDILDSIAGGSLKASAEERAKEQSYWNAIWPSAAFDMANYQELQKIPAFGDWDGKWGDSFATGADDIPYDGYMAKLHRGEMVIPARRANFIRALFGQKPVTPSVHAANVDTGVNSFVQSIPEYATGIDSVPDNALMWAITQMNNKVPYSKMDCSDLVSQSYIKGANVDTPDSTAAGIGKEWPSHGFGVLYSGDKLTKTDTIAQGLTPGDILLYSLKSNGRFMNISHAALALNANTQLHTTSSKKPMRTEGIWNGVVRILRYGQGGKGSYSEGTPSENPDWSPSAARATGDTSLPAQYAALLSAANAGSTWAKQKLTELGYNGADNTGSDSGNNPNPTPSSLTNLSDQRATFANELLSPKTKYGLMNRVKKEFEYGYRDGTGEGYQMEMETIFNRAYARGLTMGKAIVGNYWGSDDVGLYDKPKKLDVYQSVLDSVLGGSNLSNFATGNGTSNRNVYVRVMHHGEPFVIENKKSDKDWALMSGAVEPLNLDKNWSKLAQGGIVRSVTGGVPTIIGEGRYDEAVIPLNDARDHLGLEKISVNIIDAIDIVCDRICKKLDEIAAINNGIHTTVAAKGSTRNAQSEARQAALAQFKSRY